MTSAVAPPEPPSPSLLGTSAPGASRARPCPGSSCGRRHAAQRALATPARLARRHSCETACSLPLLLPAAPHCSARTQQSRRIDLGRERRLSAAVERLGLFASRVRRRPTPSLPLPLPQPATALAAWPSRRRSRSRVPPWPTSWSSGCAPTAAEVRSAGAAGGGREVCRGSGSRRRLAIRLSRYSSRRCCRRCRPAAACASQASWRDGELRRQLPQLPRLRPRLPCLDQLAHPCSSRSPPPPPPQTPTPQRPPPPAPPWTCPLARRPARPARRCRRAHRPRRCRRPAPSPPPAPAVTPRSPPPPARRARPAAAAASERRACKLCPAGVGPAAGSFRNLPWFQMQPSCSPPARQPHPQPPSPPAPSPPAPQPLRSGKIEGVDYYDFCELIRTSSL